jgi:hypothetical protein
LVDLVLRVRAVILFAIRGDLPVHMQWPCA